MNRQNAELSPNNRLPGWFAPKLQETTIGVGAHCPLGFLSVFICVHLWLKDL
jgi:hypothetical protein